jgi:transcriptional regulator with XRE-family HTH domain
LSRILPSVKEEELEVALKNIGAKLIDLRRKKGYTSHESFAYDYEIPRMHYWRIENGKTNLTIRSLMKILAIHNLTLQEFFASVPAIK